MTPPTIPARVRTTAYVVGIVLGIGVGPALLALELEPWSVATGALAGACNALAFAYRPTRPPEGWTDDAVPADG